MNLYKVFSQSLLSEISVDRWSQVKLLKNHSFVPCFRPHRILNYVKKFGIVVYLLFFLAFPLWLICLPIFFFFKFLRALFLYKNIDDASGDVSNSYQDKTLCVVLSSRMKTLSKNRGIKESKMVKLYVPWIQKDEDDKDDFIDMFSVLTFADLFKSLMISIIYSYRFVIQNSKRIEDIYQVYVAFEYFLVARALEKIIPNYSKIMWSNHYDRWAILLDRLNQNKIEKILVQHGIEELEYFPDIKLLNVNIVYYFGEYSRMWFSQNFVSNPNCLYLELEPNLKLSPTNDEASKKHKILLIGQPDMPDKEVEIMRHLLNDQRDVCLYLKPHPLYPVTIYGDLSDLGINIIEQKNFFPKVDLAINYYSTLGIEYEACGIPVIWHYNLEVEEVLNEVAKYLHKNSTDA